MWWRTDTNAVTLELEYPYLDLTNTATLRTMIPGSMAIVHQHNIDCFFRADGAEGVSGEECSALFKEATVLQKQDNSMKIFLGLNAHNTICIYVMIFSLTYGRKITMIAPVVMSEVGLSKSDIYPSIHSYDASTSPPTSIGITLDVFYFALMIFASIVRSKK